MADYFSFWKSITSDRYVLSLILGARMDFSVLPSASQSKIGRQYWPHQDSLAIAAFVEKLLQSGVISEVSHSEELVYSPIFLVRNHDGSERLILNVSNINRDCFKKKHFKMETLQTILPAIPKNAFMMSWDLVQGFYNVRLHQQSRRFFAFRWNGRSYSFNALVMGFSDSPRIFTLVVKTLVKYARQIGIHVFAYLDDTIVIGRTEEEALCFANMFGFILEQAGFFLHPEKSIRFPTQRLPFLGFEIDSANQVLALPSEKVANMKELMREVQRKLYAQELLPVREMAHVIGKLISFLPASKYAKAHYHLMERAKDDALKAVYDFDRLTVWPRFIELDVFWWLQQPDAIQKSYLDVPIDLEVATDASLSGWSICCAQHNVFGAWEAFDTDDIAELELRAILVGLPSLPFSLGGKHVLLLVDNQAAVFYLNAGGGENSSLECSFTLDLELVRRERCFYYRPLYSI